ncbi:hypothetical protein T484DRAFT_1894730 [Baffinella frigidus]|nr:hypothetical protein T484DRAFT_1894730 [Cryptophyta sp. CCMP2293]
MGGRACRWGLGGRDASAAEVGRGRQGRGGGGGVEGGYGRAGGAAVSGRVRRWAAEAPLFLLPGMLSLALTAAVKTRRTLVPVVSSSFWLVDEASCGRAGFSCFFHDFTNCSVSEATLQSAPPMLSLGAAALESEGGGEAIFFDWEAQTLAIKAGMLRHHVPPSARAWGAAWWRGQALRFLMRPRDWVEKELQMSQERIGWRGKVLALHVRHGDKLKEANRLAASDYVRAVVPMAAAVGAETVFVSTDSPVIVDEIADELKRVGSNLTLAFEGDEIRGTDITNANLQNNLRVNVTRYTLEAVRGVLLLSRADALLATFSSNFGRLA